MMDGGRYVRLDAEYLLHVRPFLTDREARVYEAAILACDGWSRPTSAASLAGVTRLHLDSVRRTLRSLEGLGLLRTHRLGPATSPHAQRMIEIPREYAPVRRALAAQGRGPKAIGAEPASSAPSHSETLTATVSSGWGDPELTSTLDHSIPRLWIGRSRDSGSGDPDSSLARSSRSDLDPPSLPSPAEPAAAPTTEGSVGKRPRDVLNDERSVPEALVGLCRTLWTTDVTRKAARRYLRPLLAIGAPRASVEELERYLRSSATASRVLRARFPIAVACMPEEFGDWLARSRRLRLLPPARASPESPPEPPIASALPLAELGERAREFHDRLARTEPSTPTTKVKPTPRPKPTERVTTP
jgi:hypothetical protein